MDYNMGLLSGDTPSEIYGNPNVTLGRSSSGLTQQMSRAGMLQTNCGGLNRGLKRPSSDSCFDDRGMGSGIGLDACGVQDVVDDSYTSIQQKKSPPSNGKKTKGRVKIKMEYIDNKLRRYTTFSKRKTGIMKKAYELSTLTGTQVMLLVASETGHVYTFATRKLQPMITSEAGKALIQTCLNSPDPPTGNQGGPGGQGGDQRMSATGFEETELTYNIADEDTKDERTPTSSCESGEESSGPESPVGQGDCVDFKGALERLSKKNARSQSPQSPGSSDDHAATPVKMPGLGGYSGLSNVMYQTPTGMLYPASALPPGVIFHITQSAHDAGGGSTGPPQFITIPLSMMAQSSTASNGNVSTNSVSVAATSKPSVSITPATSISDTSNNNGNMTSAANRELQDLSKKMSRK
ncbi:serum response factor homolog isoform X2 [Ctenocephalides felis]|uniref:serum response factor homolog isoform X2 n=1 Tax=Ctenocephalides felis TaxID=7515 RepID=UPI000E6E342C|nr:serum response factor homolog isoform X2 [Ctenocephalides felis]